jgi:tetratricopeptide (TPR) repeat protein
MATSSALSLRTPTHPSAGFDASALTLCLEAITASGDAAPPALLARTGALQLRLGAVQEGVESLTRASDRSADGGYRNTALVLCQRALRASPGQPDLLRRMAELSARQGYRGDAARALGEYVSIMEIEGDVGSAAAALRAHLSYLPEDAEAKRRLGELAVPEDTLEQADDTMLETEPDAGRQGDPAAEMDVILLHTGAIHDGSAPDTMAVAPLEGLEAGSGDEPWADASPPDPDPLPFLSPGGDSWSADSGGPHEMHEAVALATVAATEDALPLLGDSAHTGFWSPNSPDLRQDELVSDSAPGAGLSAGEEEPSVDEDACMESLKMDAATNHYDLAVAYKEMGIWNEAIKQLKLAVDAGARLLPVLELLGECYVEKGNPRRAVQILEHATRLPGCQPEDLIGVEHWLREARKKLV